MGHKSALISSGTFPLLHTLLRLRLGYKAEPYRQHGTSVCRRISVGCGFVRAMLLASRSTSGRMDLLLRSRFGLVTFFGEGDNL